MKPIFFISDLHLSENNPAITKLFLHFIQQQAKEAAALYILGDFFDSWAGDDDRYTPFHQTIIHCLQSLHKAHIPVYFIRGNRDIMIDTAFAKASGMQLLKDPTVIKPYQKNILLAHGDHLCTLDKKHQRYRTVLHLPGIRKLLTHCISLNKRKHFIQRLRHKSITHNQMITQAMADVDPKSVIATMQKYHVSLLIHGHTHRPGIHTIQRHNQPIGQRIVLGSWEDTATILCYQSSDKFYLQSLRN